MGRSASRLSVALGLAVLVHAGVAAAMFATPPRTGNAVGAGVGGIEIALGPAGGAAGGLATAAQAPPPAQSDPADEADAEQPVETPAEEPPIEPVEELAEPMEPVVEPPLDEPEQTEPTPEDEAPPSAPEPAPATDVSAVSDAAADGDDVAFVAPTLAGVGGVSGDQGEPEEGNDAGVALGGGTPGAVADYEATLSAWLEDHKKYPRRAKRRRSEGTGVLYLVIRRDGHVLDYWLHDSSGHAVLDEELLAMVERARPLPAFPPGISAGRLEYFLPVGFELH